MCKQRRVVAAVVAACCVVASGAVAQTVLTFNDPGGRFTVEFPRDWRWQIVSGAAEPLVTFVQPRNLAAVVIEHFHMNQQLAPEDITDLFAQIEVDVLKENQPRATEVNAVAQTQFGRRLIVLDYRRPGVSEPERVRQYSFPVGRDLYRLTCMAVDEQFPKFESVFSTLAQSFKPAARASGPAGARP